MTRRVARDLLSLSHLASIELCDEHRALDRSIRRRLQRRHHHVSLEKEVVDALNSLTGSRQAQTASLPITLAQSCSLKAVAEAVAHAGPWMTQGPFRSFGLFEVTRIRPCTSLRWTLALWPCRPVVFGRLALTS